MAKHDIREYSNNELSLIVYNDEFLYYNRHDKGFKELLNDFFIYTDEQLEVLENDLLEEDE